MGKRDDKLFAKIAELLGRDTDEIKKVSASANLYSQEEDIYEAASVWNFYKTRVALERRTKETDLEFQTRYNAWKFKTCKGCDQEFVYSYSYDGVAFCSLDCLDADLRKIGLQVTRGRDLKLRWGRYYPAIVPSPALANLRETYPDAPGLSSSHVLKALPKSHQEYQSDPHELQESSANLLEGSES